MCIEETGETWAWNVRGLNFSGICEGLLEDFYLVGRDQVYNRFVIEGSEKYRYLVYTVFLYWLTQLVFSFVSFFLSMYTIHSKAFRPEPW